MSSLSKLRILVAFSYCIQMINNICTSQTGHKSSGSKVLALCANYQPKLCLDNKLFPTIIIPTIIADYVYSTVSIQRFLTVHGVSALLGTSC